MNIRIARQEDAARISSLLSQLGHPMPESKLFDKIARLLSHPDHLLVVYAKHEVSAVMSVHFIPQLARDGDLAIVSYLVVDETSRSNGVGRALEEYCVAAAIERNCDRVEIHCNIRRTDAHRFYERQGYQEERKHFRKIITTR